MRRVKGCDHAAQIQTPVGDLRIKPSTFSTQRLLSMWEIRCEDEDIGRIRSGEICPILFQEKDVVCLEN